MVADYTIELENGQKVGLLFCSAAFRELSAAIGVELEDLHDSLYSGGMYKAKNFPHLLLTSANAFEEYNDREPKYTIKHADRWMDEIGMMITAPQVQEIYKVFAAKFLRIDPSSIQTEPAKEETPKKKKGTPGDGSTKKLSRVA